MIATFLLLFSCFKLRQHIKDIEAGRTRATTTGIMVKKLQFKTGLAVAQAVCVFISVPAIVYISLANLNSVKCQIP
jgi:hypothetical protein